MVAKEVSIMQKTFSHTFFFEKSASHDSTETLPKQIIFISNKNDKEYTSDYLQYSITENANGESTLTYRYKSLHIDRLYFLEIANTTIDDSLRVEKFFTVYGKRHFRSDETTLEHYLSNPELSSKKVIDAFNTIRQTQSTQTFYFRSQDNTENHYKLVPFQCDLGYFIFLNQNNISPRKSFKKLFLLELSESNFTYFNQLQSKQRVEYFFNKLGEIHFNALEIMTTPYKNEHDIQALLSHAKNLDTDNAKLQKNDIYEKLKDKIEHFEKSTMMIYQATFKMIDSLSDENVEHFCAACISFTRLIKHISALEELSSYLTAIVSFAQEGKLSYLLGKNDSDLYDIFLYTLELFSQWSALLIKEFSDPKQLERQNKDLNNAFKHLIESYLEFSHDYQINDAQEGLETESAELKVVGPKRVSAREFFNEIELDGEVIDELNELEEEVANLTASKALETAVCDGLILFYEGYARMLNSFFEFQDLGYSLSLLTSKLKSFDRRKKNEFLLTILLALVDDLINWKEQVFIQQTADWIHYMDSSFYANISQIDILLSDDEKDFETDLEFF